MAGSSSAVVYIDVDELYPDDDDDDDICIISDEKYAEDLQLQEAIIVSSSPLSSSKSKQPFVESYESSEPATTSFCGICMDTKASSEMFQNRTVCGHLFCTECIRGHVAAKIQDNQIKITCPDPSCKAVIGPDVCRYIVPTQVLERWENILCESLIMEADKFYCPFKDCSAMLVNDGGVTVTSSECPNCHRLFCAQCKVAWHCGMNCIEYKSLKKGEKSTDDMLINLAKNKKWKKCSKCNFFVEKVVGCDHITCRCGHRFCYMCGKPFTGTSHYHTCSFD
ncbi:hypothetical protein QVD17_02723 [Tagetes erecta]|uniref:RBR-type E3 ubiquitin transferase n=1 Tax=Tagetes erecta TaxID=13708 RepID=A0AAD8P937_TARER|nr:hypothetical protein QVD17_02723 [Tagetes erecta]